LIEPRLDLVEDDGHLYLEIAVPGVVESDIDVTLVGARIILMADRPAPRGAYLHQEIDRGILARSVDLPYAVDLVGASYEDGFLRLELRRRAGA